MTRFATSRSPIRHDTRAAVLEVLGPPGTWGGYPHGARYEIELKK